MPLYNFKCSACEHVFDANKKIAERDDNGATSCPECATVGSIERMLSAPLVGYSISVNGGYGARVPAGWKEVLQKIDSKSPGSKMKQTSSYL